MDQDRTIRSLKLQLRIERGIIALAALVLLARWGYSQFQDRPYAITANGRTIACVRTFASAQKVIGRVRGSVQGVKPADISFAEKVEVVRAPSDQKTTTEDEAVKAAGEKLTLQVKRTAILIDGAPTVAVGSEDDASAVIEAVKQKFGKLVKELTEEPSFKQKVEVKQLVVDPAIFCPTVEKAVDKLLAGDGRGGGAATYTVSRGDVSGAIAYRNGLSLHELALLNPGRNLNRLQIGDRLRVSDKRDPAGKPKLVVIVRSRETRTEPIPYTTETVSSAKMRRGKQVQLSPGRNGARRAVVVQTYENGVRAGSEVSDETTIRRPTPRLVAVGIGRR